VWVRARLCKLQKRCTRLAAASDKVYQLLTHGRWFSPGTPVSSTTKTGCHYIAEILLKVALNTKIQKKSINVNTNFENTMIGLYMFRTVYAKTVRVNWTCALQKS
jgi:hypothetical protein